MSRKYLYQPPEPEPELNFITKYPYKIMRFFRNMSTEHKVIGGIALLTLVILVGGIWLIMKADEKKNIPLMGEEIKIQSTQHIKPGESHPPYNSNPPTGGWMYDGVGGAGIHDKEVADELLIHSMEHGAVIVHYKSDLNSDQIGQIKAVYGSASGRKILVPRENLDAPVALTSWGRLLKLQTIDPNQIKSFIETNENRGPEKPPHY